MSARDPTIAARSKRYRDRKRSGATSAGRSAPAKLRSAATAINKSAPNSGNTAGSDPVSATCATSLARLRSGSPPAIRAAPGATVEAMGPVARSPCTLGAAILIILALLIGALALAINAQAGWRFGTTPPAAWTFAGLSIAIDGLPSHCRPQLSRCGMPAAGCCPSPPGPWQVQPL
jgi:hypothetical protein